jgi:hypothetical protein
MNSQGPALNGYYFVMARHKIHWINSVRQCASTTLPSRFDGSLETNTDPLLDTQRRMGSATSD